MRENTSPTRLRREFPVAGLQWRTPGGKPNAGRCITGSMGCCRPRCGSGFAGRSVAGSPSRSAGRCQRRSRGRSLGRSIRRCAGRYAGCCMGLNLGRCVGCGAGCCVTGSDRGCAAWSEGGGVVDASRNRVSQSSASDSGCEKALMQQSMARPQAPRTIQARMTDCPSYSRPGGATPTRRRSVFDDDYGGGVVGQVGDA